jgi:hypothetical protein
MAKLPSRGRRQSPAESIDSMTTMITEERINEFWDICTRVKAEIGKNIVGHIA